MDLGKNLEILRRTPSPTFPSQAEQNQVRLFRESLSAEIMKRKTPKVGDTLPAFNLPNQAEVNVSSADLLETGPLAFFFFRGSW